MSEDLDQLVARLHAAAPLASKATARLHHDAAAEITALRARVAELEQYIRDDVTKAERATLLNMRLTLLLRRLVIKHYPDQPESGFVVPAHAQCELCHRQWDERSVEDHTPDCILAAREKGKPI